MCNDIKTGTGNSLLQLIMIASHMVSSVRYPFSGENVYQVRGTAVTPTGVVERELKPYLKKLSIDLHGFIGSVTKLMNNNDYQSHVFKTMHCAPVEGLLFLMKKHFDNFSWGKRDFFIPVNKLAEQFFPEDKTTVKR
eukprot:Pgem_evm1s18541